MLRLILECDGCGEVVLADDLGPVARSARTVAQGAGWETGNGRDVCATCLRDAQIGRSVAVGR